MQSNSEELKTCTYTCGSTPSPVQHAPIDRSLDYQAEIENLKFQIRKQTEDIIELKSQLLQSEEVNTGLQGEVSKLSKKLNVEHKQNTIVEKLKQDCDEFRESEINFRKKIEQLKKECKSLTTENAKLRDEYEDGKTEVKIMLVGRFT